MPSSSIDHPKVGVRKPYAAPGIDGFGGRRMPGSFGVSMSRILSDGRGDNLGSLSHRLHTASAMSPLSALDNSVYMPSV